MKVLITGGFGYLGGRFAQYLFEQGHQIVLGTQRGLTVPDWLPDARVVQIDYADQTSLERACDGVDWVIHATGMNAQDCINDPSKALAVNGVATANLVEAAIRSQVTRLIYLSTAHVYCSPLLGTITEDTPLTNTHPYATSHLAGEQVVLSANQMGRLQGIVVRLSNAFGAPMHQNVNVWHLLVNDLCRQALITRQLVLHSSGMQRRDFVPISEVCRTIQYLLAVSSVDLGNGLINLGGGWTPTMIEMANLIQARCEAILGYRPPLSVPPVSLEDTQSNVQNEDALVYRMDKLTQLGFTMNATHKVTEEIDQLLLFCKKVF